MKLKSLLQDLPQTHYLNENLSSVWVIANPLSEPYSVLLLPPHPTVFLRQVNYVFKTKSVTLFPCFNLLNGFSAAQKKKNMKSKCR